jgi:putative ABC transport system ATP-binding protein/macrolide transport system ATP-binding/permease protein/lipoprotein-releasing system ATP-binding protein
MLDARNLSKSYTAEARRVDAVSDISLELKTGEFLAVVGRSGSGKSTLLAMLGGLCRPTSGVVELNGVDLWALTEAERSAFRNREVGLVFQFASLLPTLRVVDNVALPALLSGTGEDDAYGRAASLLERVGLGDRGDAYPSELSGGEQRRAAVARAIVNGPPILLADEPTSDLDLANETQVLDLLQEIHRRDRVALILVTHNPTIARRADRVLELGDGSIARSFAGSSHVTAPPDHFAQLTPARTAHRQTADVSPHDPSSRPRARLGAGFGPWLLAVCAWVVPAVFIALALNQGVALYQHRLLERQRLRKAALEDAALLWLRANIDDISFGPGLSYSLAISLENVSAAGAVFAMSPAVRAYVQVGLTWQEVPSKRVGGQEGRVEAISGRRIYRFAFEPDVKEYTELLGGYMHVRITSATIVSQRSEPGDDLVERLDDYYVHLKPHGAVDEAILRKTRFPGKPPLWIPMPPH